MSEPFGLYSYCIVTGKNKNYAVVIVRNSINKKETDWFNTFLSVTNVIAERSHCVSKHVAAVLVKDGRIISTGINGTPPFATNCDTIFEDNFDKDLHHEFSKNYEIHAEINSILSAAKNGIAINGAELYINYSPCRDCAKAIAGSGISRVIFRKVYENDPLGLLILSSCGIKTIQICEDSIEASYCLNTILPLLNNKLKEYLLKPNLLI